MMREDPASRYCAIKEQIHKIALQADRNPEEIKLIVVTKNQPVEAIQQVYEAGCRDFGENRIQEALSKMTELPIDIEWHLIGSLQTNKINKALDHFDLIHSVDSLHLAQKISEACQRRQQTIPILLQVNTSGEQTKHGLPPQEWELYLEALKQLPNLRLEGLMTMAPFTADQKIIQSCFNTLKRLQTHWQNQMADPSLFRHLSMGMSNDFPIAIEEGATLLRVGSSVFS